MNVGGLFFGINRGHPIPDTELYCDTVLKLAGKFKWKRLLKGDDMSNLDIDFAGKDIDEIIKMARAKFGTIDANLAIELLANKLQVSRGYYSWSHLEGAWFVRVPSQERLDEEWLKNEPPELIHVCAPVKFLNAVETMANKEESAHHVGYARDTDNKIEVECSRCSQKTSEEGAKKAIFQTKMHTLQKKVG